ncbi:Pex16-like peroxisomal membrane protein [Chloropicon primus]|uniref:Peroxisomal membrane protein PEX16 n=1 Tax=Chloropicon primus TaxID=1764295 RepID=A0A5B8N088_9CHLO|nr:Pex16-like peroxisomal membrane protein [Chloropicon primus]UPR04359.1 Pex16-like peroxisomal membrane protein [Chloropicon primus]|eukprot:QDZ25154.1 Pex16-like peroxisomal membrane protein [Chloropicon primus]
MEESSFRTAEEGGGEGSEEEEVSSLEIEFSDEDVMGSVPCRDEDDGEREGGRGASVSSKEGRGDGDQSSRRGLERKVGGKGSSLERYAAWYRANEHWIAPFEQALQSAIWFIPDAMGSEVGTELLHSFASMWTVGNEQVMMLTDENAELEELRSVEKRFPQFLLPLLVATVEQFETVVEVLLVQRHHRIQRALVQSGDSAKQPNEAQTLPRDRYKWLCVIEAFKAVMRLGQLYKGKGTGCLLLDGGVSGVAKVVDASSAISTAEVKRIEAFQVFRAKYLVHPNGNAFQDPSGGGKSVLDPSKQTAKFELDITSDDAKLLTLAEMMHVMRPVVYCSLLWRDGARSWRPWVTSLAVEVVSVAMTHRVVSRSYSLKGNPMCQREKEARWARLVLYLARSPFYDGFTRGRLERVRDLLKPVPLIGMAATAGYNLIDEIQGYYTYTSG